MAYIEMAQADLDAKVIYISAKELRERTGVPRSTLWTHITTDKKAAAEYEKLFKCGLLG